VLIRGGEKRPGSLGELLGPDLMATIDRLDLHSRKMFPGRLPGERRSKKRGQSVEFEDFRPYTPGLDIRHIDWKVYARLDRLFVKIFLEEEDLALHLIVDASASMEAGRPSKILFAMRLAAALGYVGLTQNNRVAMSVFGGERLHRLPPMRGRANLPRFVDFLLGATQPHPNPPAPGASFGEALKAISSARQGKGVMVLLSDFLIPEGYEEGLKYLAGARGFDSYCLQALSPGEIDPSKEGDEALGGSVAGDLRLTDVETGRAAEVTVTSALLRQYRRTLEQYCENLAAFCAKRQIAHLLLRSDAPIERVVVNELRRMGMLQ